MKTYLFLLIKLVFMQLFNNKSVVVILLPGMKILLIIERTLVFCQDEPSYLLSFLDKVLVVCSSKATGERQDETSCYLFCIPELEYKFLLMVLKMS